MNQIKTYHAKEDVNGVAISSFNDQTPSKKNSILESLMQHLKKMSIYLFTINCFDGIGNGRDDKCRAYYLTKSEYNEHLN